MRIFLICIIGTLLSGCGQEKQEKVEDPKEVYLKKDLNGLVPCSMEHSDCQTEEKCVEAPFGLGGTRQCIPQDQLGQFFGCKAGELIILPAEPWRLDCL